jgi:hypothetical protein
MQQQHPAPPQASLGAARTPMGCGGPASACSIGALGHIQNTMFTWFFFTRLVAFSSLGWEKWFFCLQPVLQHLCCSY